MAPGSADIVVASDGVEARIPVTVAAPPASAFDVAVRWVGTPQAGVSRAVEQAIAHWGRVVVGDLPDVHLTLPDSACMEGAPAVDEAVDDLLLWIRVDSMDGPGGVLGAAGPCVVRGDSGLPIAGVVYLDSADVRETQYNEYMVRRLVMHEIAHVLGLGTLWEERGHVAAASATDPRHTGSRTRLAAGDIGFRDDEERGVAIEAEGGAGTAGGHWRESVFHQELMTGWMELLVGAPLSRITIASLADLGYEVHEAAAEHLVGFSGAVPPIGIAARARVAGTTGFLRDEPLRPRWVVGAGGTVRRVEGRR